MEPTRARALILDQHDQLRRLLAQAQVVAYRAVAGEAVLAELEARLEGLRQAFAEHNACEEAMLAPILQLDSAWGPARISRMREEHDAEHRAFAAALTGTTLEVAARLAEVVEEIDAHMCAEERTFLAPSVMCDD